MTRIKVQTKQSALYLDPLKKGETLTLKSSQLTLTKGESSRFVIAFSNAPNEAGTPDSMNWLHEMRVQHGWTLLLVQALKEDWYSDKELRIALTTLALKPPFSDKANVSLLGTGMGGFAALRFASIWPNATIQSFNPLSATANAKLPKAAQLTVSEKRSLAAHVGQIYLFADPLQRTHKSLVNDLSDANLTWVKCIGVGDDCPANLSRMKIFAPALLSAMRSTLDLDWFYKSLRIRKTYYFYRVAVETALSARGKQNRVSGFRQKFRSMREQSADEGTSLQEIADTQRRVGPAAWIAPTQAARSTSKDSTPWPTEGGNVWMLEEKQGVLRYMSDRWQKTCIGYEERAGVTLAQTPPQAIGFVGFGSGLNVERDLIHKFPWHVTDETLDGSAPPLGPMSEATIHSKILFDKRAAQPSVIAVTQSQPALIPSEAERGSLGYDALLTRIRRARTRASLWGKTFHVDRLRLALAAGKPDIDLQTAAQHYATVGQDLTNDICAITQQSNRPIITVVQSAGSRTNGRCETALAEGRADLDNPTLPFIVVSPSYPFALLQHTPATLQAASAMVLDELSCHAVLAYQSGERWYCPSLQLAQLDGTQIIAQFSTLDGLEFDPEKPHGFSLSVDTKKDQLPEIVEAEVISKSQVRLTCAYAPKGSNLSLCYAWGAARAPVEGRNAQYSANQGGLRDCWSVASAMAPETMLRRYALSGRVLVSGA